MNLNPGLMADMTPEEVAALSGKPAEVAQDDAHLVNSPDDHLADRPDEQAAVNGNVAVEQAAPVNGETAIEPAKDAAPPPAETTTYKVDGRWWARRLVRIA